MKLNEYFKISVFGRETKVVILELVPRTEDNFVNVEEVTKEKNLDNYVVGQSISKNTVYVVTSRNSEFEGVGLRGLKFSSHNLGFLSSLWSKND